MAIDVAAAKAAAKAAIKTKMAEFHTLCLSEPGAEAIQDFAAGMIAEATAQALQAVIDNAVVTVPNVVWGGSIATGTIT